MLSLTTNQLAYHAAKENARHNRATEAQQRAYQQEVERSNVARETETNRANLERERLNVLNHYETVRHNQISENLDYSRLSELNRANLENERRLAYEANLRNQQLQLDMTKEQRELLRTQAEIGLKTAQEQKTRVETARINYGLLTGALTSLIGGSLR